MAAIVTTIDNLILDTAGLMGDLAGTRWAQTISATPTPTENPVQWYLNVAADFLTLMSRCYRTVQALDMVAGTSTYVLSDANLSAPFGELLRLEDDRGLPLLKTTSRQLDRYQRGWTGAKQTATDERHPSRWTRGLDGFGSVRIWPAPRAAATFQMYIVTRPTPMTVTGQYPFTAATTLTADNPSQYHAALPFYAAYRCLTMGGIAQDLALAEKYKAEFDAIAQIAAAEVQSALE